MLKYPIVIPYIDNQNGRELRYAIRSLKNIKNWNGEVILLGDKPSWYNGTHIPMKRQMNPHHDVYLKLQKATQLYPAFIWSNDDIYITEPTSITAYYEEQIDDGSGLHKRMLVNTRNYLKQRGCTTYNYDLHTPMLIESEKVTKIPHLSYRGVGMHWRSLYGNLNNIGGEEYQDQKTYTTELPKAEIISTDSYTPELERKFTKASKFEDKMTRRIAALVHFYIEDHGAGGELYIHGLLKELAKTNQVTVYVTDDDLPDTTIDGVKVIYKGNIQADNFDLLITHFQNTRPSQNIARVRNIPLVTVVHNDKPLTRQMLQATAQRDLVIYNSQWIRRDLKRPGIVLTPPIKPVKATPGDKVLLVNLTPEKGSELFFELARQMPDTQFLGVKGGYFKDRQTEADLPNLEIIENTPDMDSVYNQTKVVLMPSNYETYGMVAAEAAQIGIPTIAHPTPGLVENLGSAGIFIDREDTEQYKQEIEKLYSDKKYYSFRSKLVKDRAKFNQQNHRLAEAVKAIEDLY